jgi:hypothetical protein
MALVCEIVRWALIVVTMGLMVYLAARGPEHWERMLGFTAARIHHEEMAEFYEDEGETPTANSCPLCIEYFRSYLRRSEDGSVEFYDDCSNCLVFEDTGRHLCQDTPWRAASEAWDFVVEKYGECGECGLVKWRQACKDEIAYLRGLLDKLEEETT